jgi:hypothetical protein
MRVFRLFSGVLRFSLILACLLAGLLFPLRKEYNTRKSVMSNKKKGGEKNSPPYR